MAQNCRVYKKLVILTSFKFTGSNKMTIWLSGSLAPTKVVRRERIGTSQSQLLLESDATNFSDGTVLPDLNESTLFLDICKQYKQ